MTESFRLLAAVIGAHSDRTVNGRTRLQKTIKLLQRLGFPTDYDFRLFFYGPYSESVWFDLRLLERLGFAQEQEMQPSNGGNTPWYRISVEQEVANEGLVERWMPAIKRMEAADLVPLELAATYDSFREMGSDHATALERLRTKKGSKCTDANLDACFAILKDLDLSAA